MKISKLFHWLYFAVMMLPLLVYPIFALAVRSDNNFTPIEVQQEKLQVVNFNQLSSAGFKNSTSDSSNISWASPSFLYESFDFNDRIGHIFIGRDFTTNGMDLFAAAHKNLVNTRFVLTDYYISGNGRFELYSYNSDGYVGDYTAAFNLFDLTQMFGSGNEPTLEQFNIWYPVVYYGYDSGTNQLLHTGTSVTYNDTDVGSQMVYVGYKVVDNYFNYDNVFNFGSLYSWLEVNLFNGGAPLGFFIFWHLLIYWLLTSLLWVLFDVLMYVPQLIHRWLDKASLS